MRKSYLSLVLIFMILILVGTVNAGQSADPGLSDPPISVGGDSMIFSFHFNAVPPPSIPVSGIPFTYSGEAATHVHVWDYQCVGDEFIVFDGITPLGDTSDVDSEYPLCLFMDVGTAFADSGFSNGCFDLGPGTHEINIDLKQSYTPGISSGEGAIRVDEGYCISSSAPEFPSLALPVTMLIGFLGAVLLIQRTREH